jgi:hypothetical protein
MSLRNLTQFLDCEEFCGVSDSCSAANTLLLDRLVGARSTRRPLYREALANRHSS